jgi:hypothetical protein
MKIELHNRLPENLDLELATQVSDMTDFLKEEGVVQLVQPFYERVREERKDKAEIWIMWEGYFVDQADGTTNLYVVGVLQMDRIYYTRVMRVRSVPPDQVKQTEQDLGTMIVDYMEGLSVELSRTVKPGSGKTSVRGQWHNKNGKHLN